MTPLQLEKRIQELLDGVLLEEHWPDLQAELSNSKQARELYCSYVRIHTMLRQRSKGIDFISLGAPIIPIDEIIKSQNRRSLRYAMLSAAAVLLVALVSMWMIFIPEPVPTLTFRSSPDTKFELTHDSEIEGMRLEKGSRLVVTQGTVELNFASGVKSIVMAPADITLQEDDALSMDKGRAWFHVPEAAVGFQVRTKGLDIVDLGTEFGVLADRNSRDELHVFKGEVKVTASGADEDKWENLAKGDARRLDTVKGLVTIGLEASAFLTDLPISLPYLHWSFDGQGDAKLLAQGVHPVVDGLQTKEVRKIPQQQSFTATSGKFGAAALSSLGNGDYIESTWKGIEGNAPRTIAYWLKLPPTEKYLHPIVGWGERGADYNHGSRSTGSFYSFVNTTERGTNAGISVGGYWLTGKTPIADGDWHHIAHVYTGKQNVDGTPRFQNYIDGKPEVMESAVGSGLETKRFGGIVVDTRIDSANSVPLRLFNHLGKNANEWAASYSITPAIDELFIFQAALSSSQIRNLYQHNDYQGPSE